MAGRTRAPARTSLEVDAFRRFPSGLMVLDRGGRIVCCNEEAERLIGALGRPPKGLSCCELLGCRQPGTVLAAACLTELALSRGGALPEVRVEIATPQGPIALWVAAGAIGGMSAQGARVGLQLRPGIAQDRRQRTEPHWMTGPRLCISTLGRTVVESSEGPIGGAWLEQRSGQLLKYLVATRQRAVTVDEIGESLWSGASYAVGSSVRYYVHAVRRKLEPKRGSREPSAFITVGSGTYRLNLAHVEIDGDRFEAHVNAGLSKIDSDLQGAVAQLERGLALYCGDFLAELPYAEWAMAERNHLHDLACLALGRLAEARLKLGQLDDAAGWLERLVLMQPYDEDVHRRLMELDIMRGRRSDAVRRYDSLRLRLRRTFGHDPNFTPADLVRPQP